MVVLAVVLPNDTVIQLLHSVAVCRGAGGAAKVVGFLGDRRGRMTPQPIVLKNIKSFRWSEQKGVIKSAVFVASHFADPANKGKLLGASAAGHAEEDKEDIWLPIPLRVHDRAAAYLASGSRTGGDFLGFLDLEVAEGRLSPDDAELSRKWARTVAQEGSVKGSSRLACEIDNPVRQIEQFLDWQAARLEGTLDRPLREQRQQR